MPGLSGSFQLPQEGTGHCPWSHLADGPGRGPLVGSLAALRKARKVQVASFPKGSSFFTSADVSEPCHSSPSRDRKGYPAVHGNRLQGGQPVPGMPVGHSGFAYRGHSCRPTFTESDLEVPLPAKPHLLRCHGKGIHCVCYL